MKSSMLTAHGADLAAENDRLRTRLEEAEETIRAIRGGEIDAVVVEENHKTAVKHLVAEEVLCQSILEQVADAVIICDEKGTILRSSRAVKEFCANDPYGMLFEEAFPLYKADKPDSVITFKSLLFCDDLRGFEVSYPKGGEKVHLLLSAGTLRDPNDGAQGAVITLTDISDRKQAEALLRQADRRKDEFLATLAHELRNPLAPLHNALDVLQMAEGRPAVQKEARAIMARQLKQMVRLVDDLLDVSRISRNNIELRKENITLAAVMASALEISRPLIDAKKHSLSLSLPEDTIYLNADAVRVAQIFSNLINNAAKYTPASGKIWVEGTVENHTLTVSVRDNGIGIEPSKLPRIFDMFVQVDNSLERSHGGLGIGLTLVKNLLMLHNGYIEAKSEGLGKGV